MERGEEKKSKARGSARKERKLNKEERA